jgi:hypothetical protein
MKHAATAARSTGGGVMHHQTTHQTTRRTYRTPSTSLNPYVLEETALTLTDIRRARDESESSSGR